MRDRRLSKAKAAVEKAEERMKYAKSYINIHRELLEKELISCLEFEESKEKLDVLEKELKKAQAELKIVFQPFFYRYREENEARKFAVAYYNRSGYKRTPITLKEDNNGSKTFPHCFVSNHDNSGWVDTGGTQQAGGQTDHLRQQDHCHPCPGSERPLRKSQKGMFSADASSRRASGEGQGFFHTNYL